MNRLAIATVASALWACADVPEIQGVGSFQFSAEAVDLSDGFGTIRVVVTPEFGFDTAVEVTLSSAPPGLTADHLTLSPAAYEGLLVVRGQPDLEPDGKLVVGLYGGPAAPGSIARLTGDGVLDSEFGQDGVAELAGHAGGPRDIAVEADGSLLAVGDETGATGIETRLWKLGGAGAPDASFGSGGFAEPVMGGKYDVSLNGGQAYLIGTMGALGLTPFVARLTSQGSLDPQLGSGGVLRVPFLGNSAALSDGSGWLVAGSTGNFDRGTLRGVLALLSTDGHETPMVTDGGDAVSRYTSPFVAGNAMYVVFNRVSYAIQDEQSFIQKLLPELTPDPTFSAAADADSVIRIVALQADGKLVVMKNPGNHGLEHIVRLNPDGTIDPTVRVSMANLVQGGLPEHATLACGPAVDDDVRLVFGYQAGAELGLVRIHL